MICALFFVVDKAAYFLLQAAAKKEYDRRLELILDGRMEKDVIIMGSSRAAHDILAGQLEEETGLESYNLGYRGTDVSFHLFLLEKLIKHNEPPKKLIYVVDNPFMFSKDSVLRFNEKPLLPLAYKSEINDVLIDREVNSPVSKLLYLARIRKNQFLVSQQEAPENYFIDSTGSHVYMGNSGTVDWKLDGQGHRYEPSRASQEKLEALEELMKLSQQNDITVYFVLPPNYFSFNTLFYDQFVEIVNGRFPILVYHKDDPSYRDKAYFYDQSHLNKKGATLLTREISNYLNANKTP